MLGKIINYLSMLKATTDALMTTGNDSLIEPTTSIPINATSDIGTNQTYPSTAITEVNKKSKKINPGRANYFYLCKIMKS